MGAGKRVNYFVAQELLECGLPFEHGGGDDAVDLSSFATMRIDDFQ
jgi:hypothetical protein